MPRRTLADEYYDDAEGVEDEEDEEWLVLYDFTDSKPSTKFWSNLARLAARSPGSSLIQQSVYRTCSRRVAKAAKMLAVHYGASVACYMGHEVDP